MNTCYSVGNSGFKDQVKDDILEHVFSFHFENMASGVVLFGYVEHHAA
jgi:hypothetical protein